MSVLVEEFGFPRLWLAFLDQIQDHDRRAVSRKKVVKVPCGGGEKWVDDADWLLVREEAEVWYGSTHSRWEVLGSCYFAPASSRSGYFRDTTAKKVVPEDQQAAANLLT